MTPEHQNPKTPNNNLSCHIKIVLYLSAVLTVAILIGYKLFGIAALLLANDGLARYAGWIVLACAFIYSLAIILVSLVAAFDWMIQTHETDDKDHPEPIISLSRKLPS
jgi:hypothetical protein